MGRKPDTHTRAEPSVDLGKVRVGQADAALIHAQIIRLSEWLTGSDSDPPAGWRPPRMGAELAMARYFAWALRYGELLAGYDHQGWPERIADDQQRAEVLAHRDVTLGTCRVGRSQARGFGKACRAFDARFGRPDGRIKGAKFLTVSVVGFAEYVRQTEELSELPEPPWCPERKLLSTWSPKPRP